MGSLVKHPQIKKSQRLEGDEGSDVWGMINAAAADSPIQPVANMGQGFFGYNPPDFVLEAARSTIDRNDTHQYAPVMGNLRLRNVLAKIYSPLYERNLNPKTEVAITTGANEGLFCALMAFVESGDEVIVLEPYFSYYARAIKLVDGIPVYISMDVPEDGAPTSAQWTVPMDKVEAVITPRTKAIMINTPQNPTGKVFTREELQPLADLCVKHNILIISDEVYDRFSFTPFTRIATLSPEVFNITITICSAGKTFYATGWRVGFAIGPAHLIGPVSEAHCHNTYASPSASQEAMAIAYEQAEVNGFWETSRVDILQKMVRFNEIWDELDIPYSAPQGAYYVLVDVRRIHIPEDYNMPPNIANKGKDYKLAYFLTDAIGVAAIPLSEFYSNTSSFKADNYLRFAVCKPDKMLDVAKDRLRGLKKYLK